MMKQVAASPNEKVPLSTTMCVFNQDLGKEMHNHVLHPLNAALCLYCFYSLNSCEHCSRLWSDPSRSFLLSDGQTTH